MVVQREADISYEGQTHVIRTPLPSGRLTEAGIAEHFRAAYLRYYGRVEAGFGGMEGLLERMPVRVLNLRTSVIGVRPDVVLKDLLPRPETSLEAAYKGDRIVYVEDGFADVPTYERSKLPWGADLRGPAVIEQADTTVWLAEGIGAHVDEGGNLVATVE